MGIPFGSPAPFSATNAIPYVTGFDPAQLPHARAAIAKVRAFGSTGASGRMKILLGCDSLTAGVGAGGKQYSYPSMLASILTARGLPAYADAMIGNNNTTPPYDPNLVVGTGWTNGPAAIGPTYAQTSTTNSALSKTFPANVTQVDVWYVDSGGATFSIDIDGSGTQSITPGNTQNILKATISGLSVASHTVNINRTSGSGNVYIAAIDAYNTNTASIAIWNGGWSGSTAAQWDSSGTNYAPLNAIRAFAPDLFIFEIGTNEETGASTVAAEAAHYQNIVAAAKVSGDVLMMMHHDNGISAAYQQITLSAMQQVAAANNCPLINLRDRMGPYTQLNTLGEIYQSTVHLTGIGYADKAVAPAELLLRL